MKVGSPTVFRYVLRIGEGGGGVKILFYSATTKGLQITAGFVSLQPYLSTPGNFFVRSPAPLRYHVCEIVFCFFYGLHNNFTNVTFWTSMIIEAIKLIFDIRYTLNPKWSHHRKGRGQKTCEIQYRYRYVGF